jgi:hypothetical protein
VRLPALASGDVSSWVRFAGPRPLPPRWVSGSFRQLPSAHRAISNLKAWLHGTHRDVSRRHLQVYLDEYTFRHNRRRTPLAAFQTLLPLSTLHQPTTYHQITRRAAEGQTEPTGYAPPWKQPKLGTAPRLRRTFQCAQGDSNSAWRMPLRQATIGYCHGLLARQEQPSAEIPKR